MAEYNKGLIPDSQLPPPTGSRRSPALEEMFTGHASISATDWNRQALRSVSVNDLRAELLNRARNAQGRLDLIELEIQHLEAEREQLLSLIAEFE